MLPTRTIFAALLIMIAAPIARAADPAPPAPFTKSGCSIQFPKDWKTDTVPGATAFVFASAPQPDSSNGQQQSASIVIARVAVAKCDLMALAKKSQAGQSRDPQNKNYQPVEPPAEAVINTASAVLFGGTYTCNNKPLRNRVWLISADGRVYIITFTALASAWDTRLPAAEAAVATFKVLDEKK